MFLLKLFFTETIPFETAVYGLAAILESFKCL